MKSLYFLIFISVFMTMIAASSAFIVSTIRLTLPPNLQQLGSYLWIPFAFFPVLLVGLTTLSNIAHIEWTKIFYIGASLWLPFLTYLFLAAVIMRIYLVIGIQSQSLPTHIVGLCLVILVTGIMVFGTWRAMHYKIVTYTINVPALRDLWADKTIVLFSDSHIGLARGEKFMKNIVTSINTLSPDLVLIAGDLIDGPIFPYEKYLSPLQNIKSTYGTYYTAGNHDEYNREQEKYRQALEKYITILNDTRVIANNTQIMGILYASETLSETKNRIQSTGFEASQPSIALLHDPKNTQALIDMDITLSLSGHTHGGQFWPFSTMVKSIYKELSKGVSYQDDHAHLTTVGVGTWGPLFRLGTVPEIVVIKIQ